MSLLLPKPPSPSPCTHRPDVDVTHPDAGGHHVSHAQHGVPREALGKKGGGVGEGVPKNLRNPQTSWDPQNPAGGA